MFFSAFHEQLWFQRGSSLTHRAERLLMLTARREYWPHKSFEKLHLHRAARLVATTEQEQVNGWCDFYERGLVSQFCELITLTSRRLAGVLFFSGCEPSFQLHRCVR